jgi:crossover junction endodeoxyribonuclease RuvC
MTHIIGIDPGLSGAIVFLNQETQKILNIFDMPTVTVTINKKERRKIAPALLVNLLKTHPASHIIVENVGPRPSEGAVGAFSFGFGVGIIHGIAAGLDLPLTTVHPATWKKAMGVPADKGGARLAAMARFPEWADSFKRVKDDGRAEAALIALYGATR